MSNSYDILKHSDGHQLAAKMFTQGVPVDSKVYDQIRKTASMPFIYRWVAAMADAHVGIGCSIGTVLPTKGAIIPAAVGVDIGCFDKDTEYLSPKGWIKFSDYTGGKVLQYDPETEMATFCEPEEYLKLPCQEFIHFKTKYGIDQMLSDEHRMLVYCYDRSYSFSKYKVEEARNVLQEHQNLTLGYRHRFNTSFKYGSLSFLNLSPQELRVMVMFCADGTLSRNGKRGTVRFTKERKSSRAVALLESAGIEYTVGMTSQGVTSIHFNLPLERVKTLSSFWEASPDQLQIISDEVIYWDGNDDDQVFYSRKKEEADFIQFVFSATGYRAVLRKDERENGVDYRVFRHKNTKIGMAGTPKTHMKKVPSEDGFKYCFSVPTTFLVVRRNGNIVITGNCGMVAQRTSLKANDLPDTLEKLRHSIERSVPHGTPKKGDNNIGSWSTKRHEQATLAKEAWNKVRKFNDFMTWIEGTKHKSLFTRANPELQVGTLGGGNHFIEICLDTEDIVWVMLHSGSRGIGNKIGRHFIDLAKKDMEKFYIHLPDKDLAYFPEGTDHFNDYVEAVLWAQNYAKVNREVMMQHVLMELAWAVKHTKDINALGLKEKAVNCHHNYVAKENHFGENIWVTRKGAVRARVADLGIIPGSMGAKSFIVEGLGNPDAFHSCSHGAGRVMSRTQAKKEISLDQHIEAVKGIECRTDEGVIDESPAAYKDIDAVMEAQKDLVKIKHTLRQVLCVKG